MIAWSYSRLSDFEDCPFMFYHKYILKTVKFVPNAAMLRGKEAHKQLERDVIRSSHNNEPVCSDVAHVWPMIKAFADGHQEIMAEEQVALTVKCKPCDWFSKKAWLRGVFDVVGRINPLSACNDQVVSILDWKTGQYRPNEDQLKLYNMITLLRWPRTVSVTSALVFIDHKKSGPPVTSQRRDLEALLDTFGERAEMIQIAEARDRWPAAKNHKCTWCSITECSHAKG